MELMTMTLGIGQEGLQNINLSASMIKVQIKSKSICNKKKSPCKTEFSVQSIMDILMFQEWGALLDKYSIWVSLGLLS